MSFDIRVIFYFDGSVTYLHNNWWHGRPQAAGMGKRGHFPPPLSGNVVKCFVH